MTDFLSLNVNEHMNDVMTTQCGIIEGTSPHMRNPGSALTLRGVAPEWRFGMHPQSTLLTSDFKHCPRCGETKPRSEFSPNKHKRDGIQDYCKPCQRAYHAAYRAANRTKFRQRAADYRDTHREQIRAYQGKYEQENRLLINQRQRDWRVANPELAKVLNHVRSVVNWAKLTGRLVSPVSCEWCGKAGKVEAAHHDYNQPLEVVWLCRKCHVAWDQSDPKLVKMVTPHG